MADEAERRSAREDAEDLRRVEADEPSAEGVYGLVVSYNPPTFLRHALRLQGRARLAQQRLVEVLAGDHFAADAAGDDRRLIQSVCQLGAGHPGGLAGDVANFFFKQKTAYEM